MSVTHAKQSRLIMGDFALSGYLREVNSENMIDTGDVTVLTNDARASIPGLAGGKLSLGGPWDTIATTASADKQINDQIQAAAGELVSYAPSGFGLGKPVKALIARETSYPISAKVTDPVDWKLELLADGIVDLRGISLADLAAVTANTNGSTQDDGAATTNGGGALLHVTAYAGFTQVVFKVQHSTDGSSWADLATFTTVTAVGSERVTVAAGATVNRYLRIVATVTGSGSVTFQASFARR